MSELAASIIISAVDRVTAPARKIVGAFEKLERKDRSLERTTRKINRGMLNRSKRMAEVQRATQGMVAPTGKVTRAIEKLDRKERRFGRTAQATAKALKNNSAAWIAKRKYVDAAAMANTRLAKSEEKMQKRMMAGGGAVLIGGQMQRAGRAMLSPVTGSLGKARMFEDFEVTFEKLLDGKWEAMKRMEELVEFGAKTPFELPGVVRASITLETLTKGVLSVGDGLRMVGDVSAGVNQPIEELAVWFGRMYDGITTGRPIGEALMRMQEIGAMSGDTRNKIEEMQKAGIDGNKIWAMVADSFGRFSGMMEERNKTLTGQLSNLSDVWTNFKAAVGKPIIPVYKPIISGLTWVLSILTKLTERFPWVAAGIAILVGGLGILTIALGAAVAIGGSLLGFLGMAAFGMEWLGIKTNLATLRLKAFNVQTLLSSKGLMLMGRGIAVRFASATRWIWALAGGAIPGLVAGLGTIGTALGAITAPVWGIIAAVAAVVAAIYILWNPIKAYFAGWIEGFKIAIAPLAEAFKPLLEPVKQFGAFLFKVFGSGPPELEKFSQSAAKVGRVMGMVFGTIAKVLTFPLRMFLKLQSVIQSTATFLLKMLAPFTLIGKIATKVMGLFGDKKNPLDAAKRVTRPARQTARVAAVASLAALPAYASPAQQSTGGEQPAIVRSVQSSGMTVHAPITVNVPPGADAHAVGLEVERAVKAAMAQAERQRAADQRRNLYGG